MKVYFVGIDPKGIFWPVQCDLDVSASREVEIDIFGFWGLLSGRLRCFVSKALYRI